MQDVPPLTLQSVIGMSKAQSGCLVCVGSAPLLAYPTGCAVAVYDAQLGEQQRFLHNASGLPISAVHCSSDGQFLAAGEHGASGPVSIRVWDLHDPEVPCRMLEKHKHGVKSLAFSPNGAPVPGCMHL